MYNSADFTEHQNLVPLMAIEYMMDEIIEGRNDTKLLHKELKDLIVLTVIAEQQKKRKKAPNMPTISEGNSIQEKTDWLEKQLKNLYKSGYVSRFQNIWGKQLATLLFIMSHGFYSWLDHRPTTTLSLFLQNAGAGILEWDEEIYKFPDPEALVTDAENTSLFTDECKMTNLFIQRRNIKV
jgi:hypothetical protein